MFVIMRILLVNPPIYDFTAYDFWLQPYGLFRVAGRLQQSCRLSFFNFLVSQQRDSWGRGSFDGSYIPKPNVFNDIPRCFRRYGKPREEFRKFLKGKKAFDAVLIQTSMTYWYLGIQEVIEDIRLSQPKAKIILGGVYSTICKEHALSLGADLVIYDGFLDHLWKFLSIKPQTTLPFRPSGIQHYGVIKISDGCPFRCSYCFSPLFGPPFSIRPTEECLKELRQMATTGIENIAFYDDALLYRPEQGLIPFLEKVIDSGIALKFHTPNAINARFVSADLAHLMVRAGFASFFIGLESSSTSWQRATGGKVYAEEYVAAVRHLREAGARAITTYIIVGHPSSDDQELESSIELAHENGTKVLLSEFSPIPGTEDGEKSRAWADLEEPLSHNKTAFTIRRLGFDHMNRLKQQTHELNSKLPRTI